MKTTKEMEDEMYGDDAVRGPQTTQQKIVDLILADCASGALDAGDSYPGARQNRPGALREHVESEVDLMLRAFKPSVER